MHKEDLIKLLDLTEHIEGGYFIRTYQSPLQTQNHALMSSIFYLLTDDQPIGYFHLNKSDVMHYFHLGSPIQYFIINPDGQLETYTLGPDITHGQRLQLLVKGDHWKASILENGEFGLLSEAVSPGFEYQDMTIASPNIMKAQFPHLWEQIAGYVKI
jgi:hypothetical protein